jgi:erythromycin esterase
VTTGRGDPLKGLADLYYWQPNCEEALSLVRWMRRYNQDLSHRRKLHFLGFDIEFTSHAVPAVVAYVEKVDPQLAKRAREVLAPLREPAAENTYGGLGRTEQDKTRQGLSELLARFDSEHAKWAAKSSEGAWKIAREHAQMIQRSERVFRDFTLRDAMMADTVDSILAREPKGTKMILLGHNGHVGARRVDLSEMGALLRERHGADYFVLGTTFGSGSTLAIPMKKAGSPPAERAVEAFPLGAPPKDGFESALALADKNLFLLDLRPSSGKVGDWLSSKMPTRWVGGIFRGEANCDEPLSPKKSYDAVVYLDTITPSHLNAGAH